MSAVLNERSIKCNSKAVKIEADDLRRKTWLPLDVRNSSRKL